MFNGFCRAGRVPSVIVLVTGIGAYNKDKLRNASNSTCNNLFSNYPSVHDALSRYKETTLAIEGVQDMVQNGADGDAHHVTYRGEGLPKPPPVVYSRDDLTEEERKHEEYLHESKFVLEYMTRLVEAGRYPVFWSWRETASKTPIEVFKFTTGGFMEVASAHQKGQERHHLWTGGGAPSSWNLEHVIENYGSKLLMVVLPERYINISTSTLSPEEYDFTERKAGVEFYREWECLSTKAPILIAAQVLSDGNIGQIVVNEELFAKVKKLKLDKQMDLFLNLLSPSNTAHNALKAKLMPFVDSNADFAKSVYEAGEMKSLRNCYVDTFSRAVRNFHAYEIGEISTLPYCGVDEDVLQISSSLQCLSMVEYLSQVIPSLSSIHSRHGSSFSLPQKEAEELVTTLLDKFSKEKGLNEATIRSIVGLEPQSKVLTQKGSRGRV